MLKNLRVIAPLTLLYIALTNNIEPLNWVLGLLVATGITALIQPQLDEIRWGNVPNAILAALTFFYVSLRDLVLSSIQLSILLVKPQVEINQGIFPLDAETEFESAAILSAHAITLTPGEMVIDIDENGVLHTHALDIDEAKATEPAAQKQRAETLERFIS